MPRRRLTVPTLLAAVLLGTTLLGLGPAVPAAPDVAGVVRVNQVGYLTGDPKTAFAMTAATAPDATYRVVDAGGTVVAEGPLGADVGSWSRHWPHVERIDLTDLTAPGRYRVLLGDGVSGASPWFRVGDATELYAPLVANGVRFFQAQRDGNDLVPGVMRRRPSHLADRRARVHRPPTYRHVRLAGHLHPTGRTADVSGGWFDAGDYLKFVETTSYADSLLLVAARESADAGALRAEALYGVRWLDRMWLDGPRRLLYQVGLGDGRPGLVGDHDRWRLPQADDRLHVRRGDPAYYLKHRPALQANRRGERISPNLAGRTAAAFALAAQLTANESPARARGYLAKARAVLGRARTHHVGRLLTTAPRAYYEEDEWRDDLELGATEVALAGQALGIDAARQRADLRAAATWARAYLDSPFHGWFTLARDDQSAVAHADLVRAIDQGPSVATAVSRADLTDDLRQQLRIAARRYAAPLGFGGDEDPGADFTFGVAATELLYRRATGDDSQAALGALQRDWALGTNAWGTSLVVGAGTTYPRCPHHQVANLLGPHAGAGPELLGAVSNGPVAKDELRGLGAPGDYARPCPGAGSNPFARFDGQGAGYVDDVRAYAATEPALDYVAVSVLAFTLQSLSPQ
ncbi:MAG: hypothetical protein JWO76_3387 [Nocardioides sp.]|nr:hypothetical protein [Nocardioides sp.]